MIKSQDLLEQAQVLVAGAELAAAGGLTPAHGQAAILAGLSMLFSYFSQVEQGIEQATAEFNAELGEAVAQGVTELREAGAA
jgi:hypothetical protein